MSPSSLKDRCLFLVGYFSKIVSHYSLLRYSLVPKYPSNCLIEQEMNTVRPAILCFNNSGFHLGRPLAINQQQERRDIPIMKCKFLETSFVSTIVRVCVCVCVCVCAVTMYSMFANRLTESKNPQKQCSLD